MSTSNPPHTPPDALPSDGFGVTGADGPGASGQAVSAYLAALREDPVMARLVASFVSLSVATPLGPAEAVQTVRAAERLVLAGPPGAGKTTAMRMAMMQLAGEYASGVTRVPVFVDLATARDGDGIEDLVARALAAGGVPGTNLQAVAPALLLVDNLDRATDVYLLEGLELLLRAGGRAGPAVVLACRDDEWPAYRSWFEDVPTAELLPLAPGLIVDALHQFLPAATATSAERWLARDRILADAVSSPLAFRAFVTAVRDRSPDHWRRNHVLDALLEALLSGVPSSERPAYRAALADVALGSLGRGPLIEVDTVAMGLGVTRDQMVRTGAVVARGAKLEFVEPLLAQHCAAASLADRATTDPRLLSERLGDLSEGRCADTLVHVYSLAPDPVDFVAGLLGLDGGPEIAARCLAEPDAADPAGPSGAGTVVGALCERTPPVPAPVLYRLGEALARLGEDGAAEIALQSALEHADELRDLDEVFDRPDVDLAPPTAEWVRDFLRDRNRGLALRGMRQEEASAGALGDAAQSLGRLDADLTFERGLASAAAGDLEVARRAFEAALAIEPDRPRYLFHLGRTLVALGHPSEATSALERARDLAPERPEIEAALGEAYRAQGWIEEALMSFEAASKHAPAEPCHEQAAAELLAELGDLEAAAAGMTHTVAAAPDGGAWQGAVGALLGQVLHRRRRRV